MKRFLMVLALFPTLASAGPVIGMEVMAMSAVGPDANKGSTTLLTPTFGYQLDMAILDITPEIGLALDGSLSPKLGARVRFGKLLKPGLYAHVVLDRSLAVSPAQAGFDAGGLLDITLVPHLEAGLQLGIATASQNNTLVPQLAAGGRIALTF
jgi:hypothetical protein